MESTDEISLAQMTELAYVADSKPAGIKTRCEFKSRSGHRLGIKKPWGWAARPRGRAVLRMGKDGISLMNRPAPTKMRESGGTGRHARLRILWEESHRGSTPLSRIRTQGGLAELV